MVLEQEQNDFLCDKTMVKNDEAQNLALVTDLKRMKAKNGKEVAVNVYPQKYFKQKGCWFNLRNMCSDFLF